MLLLLLFATGFFLSLVGSLPPTLIPLTVAQATVHRGKRTALLLAAGAASAEFFQAWLAAEAAGWFLRHPAVEQGLKWAASPVFLLAGMYFLLKPARPQAPPSPSADAPPGWGKYAFVQGVVVSTFNLLAVPYWLAYCAVLRSQGVWQEGWAGTLLFSSGVSLGTWAALSVYVWAAHQAARHSALLVRHVDRIVGGVFVVLGVWTALKA